MEAFLVSTGVVALAEMGDKTQLRRVPMRRLQIVAAALFAVLGVLVLLA